MFNGASENNRVSNVIEWNIFRRTDRRKIKSDLYYSSNSSSSASLSSSSQISTDLSSETTPAIYANALHVAVEYDAADVVKLLLKYRIDPESKALSSVHQSNYVAAKAFENDNNYVPVPRAKTPVPAAEHSAIAIHQYGEASGVVVEESSTSSKSGSNNSSTNKVHCPLHYFPKSISSSLLLKNNAPSFTKSACCSAGSSPLKIIASRDREIKEEVSCDEKDSGKRIFFIN